MEENKILNCEKINFQEVLEQAKVSADVLKQKAETFSVALDGYTSESSAVMATLNNNFTVLVEQLEIAKTRALDGIAELRKEKERICQCDTDASNEQQKRQIIELNQKNDEALNKINAEEKASSEKNNFAMSQLDNDILANQRDYKLAKEKQTTAFTSVKAQRNVALNGIQSDFSKTIAQIDISSADKEKRIVQQIVDTHTEYRNKLAELAEKYNKDCEYIAYREGKAKDLAEGKLAELATKYEHEQVRYSKDSKALTRINKQYVANTNKVRKEKDDTLSVLKSDKVINESNYVKAKELYRETLIKTIPLLQMQLDKLPINKAMEINYAEKTRDGAFADCDKLALSESYANKLTETRVEVDYEKRLLISNSEKKKLDLATILSKEVYIAMRQAQSADYTRDKNEIDNCSKLNDIKIATKKNKQFATCDRQQQLVELNRTFDERQGRLALDNAMYMAKLQEIFKSVNLLYDTAESFSAVTEESIRFLTEQTKSACDWTGVLKSTEESIKLYNSDLRAVSPLPSSRNLSIKENQNALYALVEQQSAKDIANLQAEKQSQIDAIALCSDTLMTEYAMADNVALREYESLMEKGIISNTENHNSIETLISQKQADYEHSVALLSKETEAELAKIEAKYTSLVALSEEKIKDYNAEIALTLQNINNDIVKKQAETQTKILAVENATSKLIPRLLKNAEVDESGIKKWWIEVSLRKIYKK